MNNQLRIAGRQSASVLAIAQRAPHRVRFSRIYLQTARAAWGAFFLAVLVFVLALPFALPMSAQTGSPPGEFEWRFALRPNQVASSNISSENICRRRHHFSIPTAELPAFVHLDGSSEFDVDSRATHNVPVRFDAAGLKPAEYQGMVTIRCSDCRREPGCTQDRQSLHIFMTIAWELVDPNAKQAGRNLVPGRVLVLVSGSGPDDARNVGVAHGMVLIQTEPLSSLNAVLAIYSLPSGADVQAKVAELDSDPSLQAQPDFLYSTAGQNAASGLQYGRKLIHADRLATSMTGNGVRVAIVDTGIDVSHPALKGRIVESKDVTGTGFTSDSHGTLLAGILVASERNGPGITGVAPGVEVLAIKACQSVAPQSLQAQCWSLTLARALDAAIQKNARVVNLSLGGPPDRLVTRLIEQAVSRGVVVVAAAGNDGPHGQPSFPAVLPSVVSVTAVDANEQLYSDATQGDFVQVAAPGVEIVSTSPGGKLLVASGTSLATAFVSGTAALLISQQPQLSPNQIQSLLEGTAKRLGSSTRDAKFGSGLIDACRAASQLAPSSCQ
jgi:subtilisin family serine protease